MRFKDENIRLRINGLSFKAFLEDSDINHVTKEQPLPFSPLSFVNDAMATRLNETAKFTFNVFSETREECITNYRSLLALIQSIKPIYYILDDQYVPSNSNVTGLVNLSFLGMPSRNSVDLHLTSFNYSINKEIGYIEIPLSEISNTNKSSFYDVSGMKLVPLAYKISLDGKVLLPFNSTIRKIGERKKASSANINEALIKGALSTDKDYIDKLKGLYEKITNQNIVRLSDQEVVSALAKVKQLADEQIISADGKFNTDKFGNGQLTPEPGEAAVLLLSDRQQALGKFESLTGDLTQQAKTKNG